MRICSLLPGTTEIVGALGLAGALVGRSAECDWPPEVAGVPVVTASLVDTTALTGREIDAAVRAAVSGERPLYALDAQLLEELAPDVVLTQDLCTVCAVTEGDVAAVGAVGAEVLSFGPRTIGDIERDVLRLAARLGVADRGAAVVQAMEARMEAVRRLVAGRPVRRAFVAEWLDPPFAPGHWIPEMVARAGGADVLGRAGAHSFPTTWDAVREAGPEVIVLAPCGFDARRAAEEAAALGPLPCPAVAVDANSYFSRPAPRVAEGVVQLAHILHPDVVPDPGMPAVAVGSGGPQPRSHPRALR